MPSRKDVGAGVWSWWWKILQRPPYGGAWWVGKVKVPCCVLRASGLVDQSPSTSIFSSLSTIHLSFFSSQGAAEVLETASHLRLHPRIVSHLTDLFAVTEVTLMLCLSRGDTRPLLFILPQEQEQEHGCAHVSPPSWLRRPRSRRSVKGI